MPLFKQDATGAWTPLQEGEFPREEELEKLIEVSPHLLIVGDDLAIIGRQLHSAFNKRLDLLAVDKQGALVVIELKKDRTPREVLAQVLEYGAWVSSLDLSELDRIAAEYGAAKRRPISGITDAYRQAFHVSEEADEGEDDDQEEIELPDPAEAVTFNHTQRLVIVAQDFTAELEHTLRYLRTVHGVDIYGIRVTRYQAGSEEVLGMTMVVGREALIQKGIRQPSPPRGWLETAKAAVQAWPDDFGGRLTVKPDPKGPQHFGLYLDQNLVATIHTLKTIFTCRLRNWSAAERDQLEHGLSAPKTLAVKKDGSLRFQARNDKDLTLLKEITEDRSEQK